MAAVALNLWTGELPTPRGDDCRKIQAPGEID